MKTNRKPVIFGSSSYGYLVEEMLKLGKFKRGEIARSVSKEGGASLDAKPFPDGEHYHRLLTDVEGREVVLVGGTISEVETMELYHLANVIVEAGALRLTIVIPYFGYSTMERAIEPNECVKAKYIARMFSFIPRAPLGNRVFLLDLHTEGIPYYFENGVTAKHVYAQPLILSAIVQAAARRPVILTADIGDGVPPTTDPFVLASTDAGRAKWVETYVKYLRKLGVDVIPAFVIKGRISGDKTVVRDISADVAGKLVVAYDDIARTCGTIIGAAEAYVSKGASEIMVAVSHGVFPGVAVQRLKDSRIITRVIASNSHPNAVRLADDFVNVVSVADLFRKSLNVKKRKHETA